MTLPATMGLAGCVLAPAGTSDQQKQLDAAGRVFEQPVEDRALPEIGTWPTWEDVLHRALLANGELESAYFEWKAAMVRIDSAAAYPNFMIAPSFDYMFSREKMKAWDRTTLGIQPAPGSGIELPMKAQQRGKVALAEAQQAAAKFRAGKFNLQKRVLQGYIDLALMQEQVRIQQDNVDLLKLLVDSAGQRVRAGAAQQDLLRAQTQWRLAENELGNLKSQEQSMRAMLNAMMGRDATDPLQLPDGLPEPRKVTGDDAALIASATVNNPELDQLAAQVKGRADAAELARMAYIPDFSPNAAITGEMSKSVGAMLMLPGNLAAVKASIREQQAMMQSAQAMLRQTRSDRAAGFVAALVSMRNSERQAKLFQEQILPAAEQTLASARRDYSTGTGSFIELIDAQRTLLEVRLMTVEVRAMREKELAEMESLAGVDVETIGPAAVPTTQVQ